MVPGSNPESEILDLYYTLINFFCGLSVGVVVPGIQHVRIVYTVQVMLGYSVVLRLS